MGCYEPSPRRFVGPTRQQQTHAPLSGPPPAEVLEPALNYEVAMTREVSECASAHLLQHSLRGTVQEDLCFALWRPSTGRSRKAGLVYEILLPGERERDLHDNASFQPAYMKRAISEAVRNQAGLAFMHSHPGKGWQGMSQTDVIAERDILAYPAGATGLPLLGMTIGADGYWSARFWKKYKKDMSQQPCRKVRVVGPDNYMVHFDDERFPPPLRREVLRRTFDTWGIRAQGNISRLRVGVVGLGSVGCVVAEALARIGVSEITLIDPDLVEEHNLDRLLHASEGDIGKRKVEVAEREIRKHSTSLNVQIRSLALSIQEKAAYEEAIDCDVLFSCVDRPVGRDVLNLIAYAHLIPVIDGGIAIQTQNDYLHSAHWQAHIIGPGRQCMRCNGQYNTSMVVTELDGSLDDPSYVMTLPERVLTTNQNVFPFSLSLASMEVNMMLHYLLALDWWPRLQQQDYQFTLGSIRALSGECRSGCEIQGRLAVGDATAPQYLREPVYPEQCPAELNDRREVWQRLMRWFRSGLTRRTK